MFTIILTWLLIASIIYIPITIFETNDSLHDLNDVLIDRYVMCLFWPIALIILMFIAWFILVKRIFQSISWCWEYLGEIYWDILYFKAFMQQTLQKPW